MKNLVFLALVLYFCQMATAYCCFRDPYMLPTTPCTNMCGCSANIGPTCNCGAPCNCFRDLSNVCNVCDQQPSPVCQCLSQCGCDNRYPLYFPEVEYPLTILDIDPFFYRTCFSP
ncbi:uncharacterized protein LOC118262940 [Spodoptera frugiperda]|uniref:Uncharacterized protein LOC118262940 n=1 Tax=Spodoptera frugiperda TaxID=7108 RepID=A0A9R0CVD7_SPOFR|nr:uncharacterized protein LOC118262940 [Spodoptera frugiperda]